MVELQSPGVHTEEELKHADRRKAARVIVAAGLEVRASTQELIDAAHMVYDELKPEVILDDIHRHKRKQAHDAKEED